MGRIMIPMPGLTDDEMRALSRQMRYKMRRMAAGQCPGCGKPNRVPGTTLCPECLAIHRERMRLATGATRRNTRAKSYVLSTPSATAPAANPASPVSTRAKKSCRRRTRGTHRPRAAKAAKG